MSNPTLTRLLTRMRASMETVKRRTWWELQRHHYYVDDSAIRTPQDLARALQHFHVSCTDAELLLLFFYFPDDQQPRGFSFRRLAQRLYPAEEAADQAKAGQSEKAAVQKESPPRSPNSVTVSRIPSPPASKAATAEALAGKRVRKAPRQRLPVMALHRPKFTQRKVAGIGPVYEVTGRTCAQETMRASYETFINTGHWVRV